MRRFLTGLKRAINSIDSAPAPFTIRGTTDLTFGCESCPRRTTVAVQAAGGLCLNNVTVPLTVVNHVVATGEGRATGYNISLNIPSLDLNQDPCAEAPNACPYGDAVTETAASVAISPDRVTLLVDPAIKHIDPQG